MMTDHMKIQIKKHNPSPEIYNSLRNSVGWTIYRDLKAVKKSLKNTLYCVCAFDADKIIGMGRIIGDHSITYYIQDVIVLPEYQKKGIGSKIMEKLMQYVEDNAIQNTNVGLMSAKGKENFYGKYGFEVRPNEKFGAGMCQFWKKKN